MGLVTAAVTVPLTLSLVDKAYSLGGIGRLTGEALPAAQALPLPQANFFGTVLSALFLNAQVPWGPVMVGAAVGAVAVLIEYIARQRGVILSSLALAVGIYLPAVIGIGILLGALARFLATRKMSASTHEGILTAAGLITGDAMLSLGLGGLIIAGIDTSSVTFAETLGAAQSIIGVLAMAALTGLVTYNYSLKPEPS